MWQNDGATINNPYTDWIGLFRQLQNTNKMRIVELGFGEGTKYLQSAFKEVVSIELSRYWYDSIPKARENWHMAKLESLVGTKEKDDVLIETFGATRPDFSEEVDRIVSYAEKYAPDIVFVDFGYHFRGEVVQELIDREVGDAIAYHDTNEPYYGYDSIKRRKYRNVIETQHGQGTTILYRSKKWQGNPDQ